jgi:hypothetical protein
MGSKRSSSSLAAFLSAVSMNLLKSAKNSAGFCENVFMVWPNEIDEIVKKNKETKMNRKDCIPEISMAKIIQYHYNSCF